MELLRAPSLHRRAFKDSIRESNSTLQLDTDKVCSFTAYARFPFNVPLWDRGYERHRWDVMHVRDDDVERCLQVVVDSYLLTTLSIHNCSGIGWPMHDPTHI